MGYASWSSAPSSRLILAKIIYRSGPAGSGLSLTVREFLPPVRRTCADRVVSADDLPLNVSRETLQNASFLRQIKQAILRRIVQSFTKIAEDEPERFPEVHKVYGNVFKLGAIEDSKNSDKLVPLVRFATNQRNSTSLNEVCFHHL